MTIGVIIVNYYTEALVQPLVTRLVSYPSVSQVIVFDNGSANPLSFASGSVRVMSAGRNLGFGAAVNRAFAALTSSYVLLINPDAIADAASVERLLQAARSYGCPLVGPRFYWDDEGLFRLPPATGAFPWLAVGAEAPDSLAGRLRSHAWAVYHDHYWAQRAPFRLPFLSGACLLLARDWLLTRGRVFDERFFMYFEDTDLCMDVLSQGWQPLCVPGAEVIHYWDQSPEPQAVKSRMMAEAGHLFRLKHSIPDGPPSLSTPSSSPPLPGTPWEDLGLMREPPCLVIHQAAAGGTLEVAVGEDFVPFAQARLGPEGLLPWSSSPPREEELVPAAAGGRLVIPFPGTVWARLRAGHYLIRLRAGDGRVIRCWRWRQR